jgi:hypothetical protein
MKPEWSGPVGDANDIWILWTDRRLCPVGYVERYATGRYWATHYRNGPDKYPTQPTTNTFENLAQAQAWVYSLAVLEN